MRKLDAGIVVRGECEEAVCLLLSRCIGSVSFGAVAENLAQHLGLYQDIARSGASDADVLAR